MTARTGCRVGTASTMSRTRPRDMCLPFRGLSLGQVECGHLFATEALCRFDDFRVEGRGPECQPFAERLDGGLCHGKAGEPFVFGRDDVPGCRRVEVCANMSSRAAR